MTSENNIEIITMTEVSDGIETTNYGYFDENKQFVVHRDGDLPSTIAKHISDGAMYFESYSKHGVEHRDGDLPSFIKYEYSYNLKDNITLTCFKKNGKYHRDNDFPAFESIGGSVIIQIYYLNGNIHRDGNKPAFIKKFKENGADRIYTEHYLHGKRYRDSSKKNGIKQKVNLNGSKMTSVENEYGDILLSSTKHESKIEPKNIKLRKK